MYLKYISENELVNYCSTLEYLEEVKNKIEEKEGEIDSEFGEFVLSTLKRIILLKKHELLSYLN